MQIIPPPEWKPRSRPFGEDVDNMIIPAPIEQMVMGERGIYQQFNIQRKPLTVKEFRALANSAK